MDLLYDRFKHFFETAKWTKKLVCISCLINGPFLIFGANSFFQSVPNPKSSVLVVITGLIFVLIGLLEVVIQNSLASGIIKIVLATIALIVYLNA